MNNKIFNLGVLDIISISGKSDKTFPSFSSLSLSHKNLF